MTKRWMLARTDVARWASLAVAVAFLCAPACSDPGSDAPAKTDTAANEVSSDVAPVEVQSSDDADATEDAGRVGDTTTGPVCPGGAGCACVGNGDCDSGHCLETAAGRRCGETCVSECPPLQRCGQAPGSVDLAYVCLDRFARLCMPCKENKDCQAAGMSGARCLSAGAAGAYCGTDCSVGEPCGNGFACIDAVDVGGVSAAQCVPEGATDTIAALATCSCSVNAVELAAETTCVKAGTDGGACPGAARCLKAGDLAACAAKPPQPEICNGVDDDCNGKTDEAACDDKNACTSDTCEPAGKGCVATALPDKAACTFVPGGDAPPIPGHCIAGTCVPKPVLGSACSAGGECESGFCVDGVCCNKACNGLCEACAAAKTGVKDGACGPVQQGQDPEDECTADPVSTCLFVGHCDGKGACEQYAEGTVCADATCDLPNDAKAPSLCKGGVCKAGAAIPCITSESCMFGYCSEAKCHVKPTTDPCDDGDPCTKADTCGGGVCKGQPGGCDDKNLCTIDACAADGKSCEHKAVADETPCSGDGQRWCQKGKCVMLIGGLDCAHVQAIDPKRPSGVYLVDPDDQGPNKPFEVYCDLQSGGGGWSLMSQFGQHKAVIHLTQARYEKSFVTAPIWIQGNAESKPMAPGVASDDYTIQSHDWRKLMHSQGAFLLRQEAQVMISGKSGPSFDVAYRFRYNGRVLQDGAPVSERVWKLADRQVLKDASGIEWDVADGPARFWLPFTIAAAGESVFTACFGAQLGAACEGNLDTILNVTRRFGNCGIIGQKSDSTDPALSWAPHLNGQQNSLDIAWQHQASGAFHSTGQPIALRYWTRGLCGDGKLQDGEHCDDGNRDPGDGCTPLCRFEAVTHCAALHKQFPDAPDGLYTIDPDGEGPIAALELACDMQAGGLTLVGNLMDGPADDLPNEAKAYAAGFAQLGSGSFGAVKAVARAAAATAAEASAGLTAGQGSAAVSPAFVKALVAAGQTNLGVCLVGAPGLDVGAGPDPAGPELECRRLGDASMTAAAFDNAAILNPALKAVAAESSDAVATTFARLVGMPISADTVDPLLLTDGAGPIAISPGAVHGFGGAGKLTEGTLPGGCHGVWRGEGDGIAYRPLDKDDGEVGGCVPGGGKKLADVGGVHGVRLWLGPPLGLGGLNKPAASCKAIRDAGDGRGNGRYQLIIAGGKAEWRHCEMRADGGGWTQVMRIDPKSVAHAAGADASGDAGGFVGPFKLDDASIVALTTGARLRYACGPTLRAHVTNAKKAWTSQKANGLQWSIDRDRDGSFECAADDGGGYGFTDVVACASGATRFVAKEGLGEGGGCWMNDKGWGQAGGLWAR